MNILMISGDKKIMNEKSSVYERMKAYASMCDELHIVVLTNSGGEDRVEGNLFLYPASGNKIMQRFSAMRKARAITKSRTITVITVQSPDELGFIAYTAARLSRIPLQIQVHTDIMSPWYRSAGIVPRIKYMFARFLLRRARCIRVVSRRIAQSVISDLGVSKSLVTILPVFTDIHTLQNGGQHLPVIQDTQIQNSACAIITAGRFVEREKNISMLIRAMKNVVHACPTAVLMIVGEGPDEEYYKSLIIRLNLSNSVFLKSWQHDLMSLYQSFDLFALPSYIEGWGMAVIEAMAAGLAVVMTDVGVARDIVHDRVNGIVVPVNNESALTEALIHLCKDADTRHTYVRAGKEAVEHLAPRTREEYLIQWRKSFDCCTTVS